MSVKGYIWDAFSKNTDALFLTAHECLNHGIAAYLGARAVYASFFFLSLITPVSSVSVSADAQCPSLQVDEWKFPQTARHNITGEKQKNTQTDTQPSLSIVCAGADERRLLSGFNLVRRFSLLKSADVKKIRNPRGPAILRLGKTALLRPTE